MLPQQNSGPHLTGHIHSTIMPSTTDIYSRDTLSAQYGHTASHCICQQEISPPHGNMAEPVSVKQIPLHIWKQKMENLQPIQGGSLVSHILNTLVLSINSGMRTMLSKIIISWKGILISLFLRIKKSYLAVGCISSRKAL